MDTSAVSPAITGAAQSSQSSGSAGSALTSGGDFTTFLNLLTAQLRNQDPLDPTDPTQFVAQLAQFSSVEQQVQTNETLQKILSSLGGQGPGALAPWLGASVSAPAALNFDGETPLKLKGEPNGDATGALLEVRSADGLIVARVPANPLKADITWDGKDQTGRTQPAGYYSFTRLDADAEGGVTRTELSGFSKVMEARVNSAGGVDLVLEGGDVVDSATITALRNAAG